MKYALKYALLIIGFIIVVGLIGMLCNGCLPDRESCGDKGAMRCSDNVAQVCTDDGVWLDDDNCSEVVLLTGEKASWTCCETTKNLAECSPDKECVE